ncbi:MAG: stage V sporulation protein AD [Clostridia bacterium]|nr:stage V sporulation protein AD [Clostridia bacterium]
MGSYIKLKNPVSIFSTASVVGNKEHHGPMGDKFDHWDCDDRFGADTWERSESEMQKLALNLATAKAHIEERALDAIMAGDLINQCTSSAYGLLHFDIPFFGLYGACSTAAESLILASLLIDGGHFSRIGTVVSSHNCSAERQFRFPLEYGGQRTPTSQWTVTGAAAFLLSCGDSAPYISELLPGRSYDFGINDANDMGAAMAPAAADTILRYFRESGTEPGSIDKIITGDLGLHGYKILCDLTMREGLDIRDRLTDCGMLIYDLNGKDVHCGGSGCGCSAVMLSAHFLNELQAGNLGSLLFIGTGALMSPAALQQGENIPGIAHLVRINAPGR